MSSGNVGRYESLTGEYVLLEKDVLEKAPAIKRFEFSSLGGELKKQSDIAKVQYRETWVYIAGNRVVIVREPRPFRLGINLKHEIYFLIKYNKNLTEHTIKLRLDSSCPSMNLKNNFLNKSNNKTNEPQKVLLNLSQSSNKHVTLQNWSIYHPTTRRRGEVVTTFLCTSRDVAGTSKMKQPRTSRWTDAKTSQWYVFTTFYWEVVTTSEDVVTTMSHRYVFTTSETNLKWNTEQRLIGTSPIRLSSTCPRRPIRTSQQRLL